MSRSQNLSWSELLGVVAIFAVMAAARLMLPPIDARGAASWSNFPWLGTGIMALAVREFLRFCTSRDLKPMFRPVLSLAGITAGFFLFAVVCVLLRAELRSLGLLILCPMFIVPVLVLLLDGKARKRCEQ